MCVVLIASFACQAPLMAAYSGIKVNVAGKSVNVTPGQWVTVSNGPTTTSYNVRYVNGKPMALNMKQYTKLIFGGGEASAATAGTSAQAATVSTADSGAKVGFLSKIKNIFKRHSATTPVKSTPKTSVAPTSGAKSSGSFIKDEINSYGKNIKESFQSGKTSGQNVGNKVANGAKSGVNKVGKVVKGAGSKIGNLLKSAKDRIARLFHRKPATPAKGSSSNQSSQSSQSSQQSSQSSQQSGEVSQSSQVSQSATAAKKQGFFSKLKNKTTTKFKSGYVKGKAMTNEGVSNVKNSLKSGFSAKNLLVTAGITVGVDFATQMMRGEKPSLKKAVKTVCSAEFAGGVVGSVTGAAAGSFFTPFLTAIPVVGGVLSALAPTFGSIVGGSVGAYLAGDLKNGRFSIKRAFKQIDWVGVGGQTIGSTAGAMLGSMIFPPFGTIIGGIAGGFLGNWAAHKLAGLFGRGKHTSYGSIGMPVGSNPYGGAAANSVTGPVSIGAVAGSSEIPVAGNVSAPQVSIAGDAATMGGYDSEVQLAEAKYQELYKLYNEMLSQGRQADAMKVAQEMNKAKAAYDSLKAKAGK